MNPVFLSAGIGKWYSTGAMRLKGSLIGQPVDTQMWIDDWPPVKMPRDSVYNIKAAAFEWAMKQGYTTMIWGDASVYARKPIGDFLAEIAAKGYWLGQSGHNAAQTCSDACLQYFGVDRDTAQGIHDCATGLFAMNIEHEKPRHFVDRFIQAARDGVFKGSRQHGGQSKDPRFKFHRQDQSAATMIASKLGLPLDNWQSRVAFAWDLYPAMFKCQGM